MRDKRDVKILFCVSSAEKLHLENLVNQYRSHGFHVSASDLLRSGLLHLPVPVDSSGWLQCSL